jgi:hypothetical protein
MSDPRYSILPARAVFDARLNCTELRVLAALGTYTDREGWCFPSQKELVEKLGIARSTLCAAIKKLASTDIAYLDVRPRTSRGRGKVGNEYRVRMDLPALELPMSAQPDNGKKPMSIQPDIGPQRIEVAPMSGQQDNGADVRPAGQPMSGQLDIAYTEVTTPIERPQSNNGGKGKRGSGYSDEFNTFWLSWPKPIRQNSDKATAYARWQAARKRWDPDTLMGAAKLYLRNTKVADSDPGPWRPRTCQAQVFLNGKLEAAVEAFLEAGSPESQRYDKATKQWVSM